MNGLAQPLIPGEVAPIKSEWTATPHRVGPKSAGPILPFKALGQVRPNGCVVRPPPSSALRARSGPAALARVIVPPKAALAPPTSAVIAPSKPARACVRPPSRVVPPPGGGKGCQSAQGRLVPPPAAVGAASNGVVPASGSFICPVATTGAALAALAPSGNGSVKRRLSEAQEVCWDFVKKGSCPRGTACQWSHDVDPDDFIVEPAAKKARKQGSGIKGRTDEDRAQAREEYAKWQAERVEMGKDPDGLYVHSNDWWYAQTCLVCLAECDLTTFEGHKKSFKHTAKYKELGGLQLRPGVIRPNPHLEVPLAAPDMQVFLETTAFANARVLVLGEQDYSFSLAVAQGQHGEAQGVRLWATSYLAAHDPEEPEVHVKDDGVRSTYQRKSLPAMDGALEKNIVEIQKLGGIVLHSVDATDLPGTLLTQNPGGVYDVIVFPFPRASLRRGVDPKNPQLLRYFFRSVNEAALLSQGGAVELLLLRSQYPDWDTACVALEAGFELKRHAPLPEGFYQSREMSGKTWTPKEAEVYVFSQV